MRMVARSPFNKGVRLVDHYPLVGVGRPMSRAEAKLTTYGVLNVCSWCRRLTTRRIWVGCAGGYIRLPNIQNRVTHKGTGPARRVFPSSDTNDAMSRITGVVPGQTPSTPSGSPTLLM